MEMGVKKTKQPKQQSITTAELINNQDTLSVLGDKQQ